MIKKFGERVLFQAWLRTMDPKAWVTVGFTTFAVAEWEERDCFRGYEVIAYTLNYKTMVYEVFLRDPLTGKPMRWARPKSPLKGPISAEAVK